MTLCLPIVFPTPLHAAVVQALTKSDRRGLEVSHVGMTAAPILAPGRRPNTVGKRDDFIDINHFHVSSGHLNERLLREAAGQHRITLKGVLQPCGGWLEAKGVRAGVPRRTTSRPRTPMGTVHIDLAGPSEASMGGSRHLIMFVDKASRWARPYGMRAKSETPAYVQKVLADTSAKERPLCFGTGNGGKFTDRSFVEICDRCRDSTRVHGRGQAEAEQGCRERDLVSHEGWPCGSPRGSRALPERQPRPDCPCRGRRQPPVAGSCPLGDRLFQPVSVEDKHRVAATVLGVLPERHDAGGSQDLIRLPVGTVLRPEQRVQPLVVRCEGHQGLDGRHLRHQRRGVDSPACARYAHAGTAGCGGFRVRRRAGNTGFQHHLRAAAIAASVAATAT